MKELKRGKKWSRMIFLVLMFTFLLLGVTGCKDDGEDSMKKTYTVYLLNRAQTKIVPFEYSSATEDDLQLLGELIEVMSEVSDKIGYQEVVRDFMITGYSINDGVATITVSEGYKELSGTTEVLTRAALVRTICQLDGIEYVMMKVEGQELKDSDGIAVGAMNAEQFVDNEGNEINTYENVDLTLYFASEDGKSLIQAVRQVEYSSNISMARLLMEKLIGGPVDKNLYATINPKTKIENITIKDGICYVSLSEEFLTQHSNVTPEVAIYSVVNTLVELESVNKVQISINGDSDVMFREIYDLNALYSRNLDIVMKKEK